MKLIGAVILSALLMLVILFVPALRTIFSIPILPVDNIVEVLLLVISPIFIVEIFKLFRINSFEDEE